MSAGRFSLSQIGGFSAIGRPPAAVIRRKLATRRSLPLRPALNCRYSSTTDTAFPGRESSQNNATEHETNSETTVTLSAAQRQYLDSALRVNHAGELAATLIYAAQTPPIVQKHPHLRPLMQHMYDQEAGHFKTFNELLAKHRVRPTVMYPIWSVAASSLGWATAMISREAAMACTEAVETEIGEHYNNQIRVLLQWTRDAEKNGKDLGPELQDLVETLKRIRDEELEHLDQAVEHDAKEAQPYELLTNVIRGGCRAAIWISERV